MKSYIQQTIQDLTAEIAKIQDAINILFQMGGSRDGEPVARAAVEYAPATKRKKEEGFRKIDPRTLANTEAGRRLKEPFNAAMLEKEMGGSKKAAEMTLYRWKNRGYVRAEGKGFFVRTQEFPGKITEQNEALRQQIHKEIGESGTKE